MTTLTPRQSRAAALVILVFAVAIVICVIAVPLWLLNRRYDSALDDSTIRLGRYSKIVGMRDGLQKKAAQVKALEANHHWLKSASPALVAAELQEQARTIIDANGGKLSSSQTLAHKDDGPYRQVSVALQLTAPLSAIKKMLHALESAHPYLFIDNFSIRAPYNVGARIELTPEPDLLVQFNLTGYAMKGVQ
jgi:general secretion pathway protein M